MPYNIYKQIILMISLQDQIKKFEKMVYNRQLAQFVTVDQMFVGGGITMESIIHQSNFVVGELKKMNTVFLNYCKLNEKVYAKIVEHELSIHSQHSRLNALVSSIDRKLQDGLKKIKELHEDTLSENQKSHTALYKEIEPIKEQLDSKVDLATFSAQMKKFLDQYDQTTSPVQEDHLNQSLKGQMNEVNNQDSPASLYPRKKGKVGYDEFYKFRQELDNLLKQSSQNIDNAGKTGGQAKDLILKYIPQINNLNRDISDQSNQIYKLSNTQIDHASQLTSSINKLNSQLNSRLNENVWNSKFDSFLQKQIKPIVLKLQQQNKIHKENFNSYKDQSLIKFRAIDSDLLKNKSFQQITKNQIERTNTQLQRTIKTVQLNDTKNQQLNAKLAKNLQSLSIQLKKTISQVDKKIDNGLQQLKISLTNLSNTICQTVIKEVSKRFDMQLKSIDNDIRVNRQSMKQLNYELGFIMQQIKNIKDLLSHKANFSDIILHVEKKADKEDFKELQHKINQTSQNFYSKNLTQSINTTKIQKTENGSTRRIPSLSRTSKTLLVPPFTPNAKNQKNQYDSGTKLFMCGFQNHLGEPRKQSSQTSRRKSMKSSVAVAPDFNV